MKKIEMSLKKVSNDLRRAAKEIEKIAAQLDTKTKAAAKPAKKAKKVTKRKISARQSTAIDTVFRIIKGYHRGASIAAIKKKTGYDDKKIYNIVYKLKTQRTSDLSIPG